MKKTLCSLAALASLAFAAPTAYNYEITPTIGGVLPEGNLDLKDQLTYGLRFGFNLDNNVFSQIELGYDRSSNVDYKAGRTDDTNFNRYYANLVKEYKMSAETALYALIGLGYEDISNEQLDNKSGAFAQYGGGVKYWVTDNFALKAEVRHAIKSQGDNNMFYSLGFVIPFGAKAEPVVAKAAPVAAAPIVAPAPVKTPKCQNVPKGTVVDEDGCPKIIRLHVNFDFDKSTVKPEFMPEVQKVADFMKQNPGYSVVLEGHTDAKGSDAYNMKLSDQRAKAVAKALESLGVSKAKVTTEAYGESKPVATNDTEAGRAENRRVDAKFKQ